MSVSFTSTLALSAHITQCGRPMHSCGLSAYFQVWFNVPHAQVSDTPSLPAGNRVPTCNDQSKRLLWLADQLHISHCAGKSNWKEQHRRYTVRTTQPVGVTLWTQCVRVQVRVCVCVHGSTGCVCMAALGVC